MNKMIIGVDPDSSKSGFAVYYNGELVQLTCYSLIDIYRYIKCEATDTDQEIELHIENVNGVSAAFTGRDSRQPMPVKLKMAQFIGRCKQAQIEIERIAEHFNIKVVHHKVSKMWKKDKAQFEKVTCWKGRSNEDSRSAAYFGFLGLTK